MRFTDTLMTLTRPRRGPGDPLVAPPSPPLPTWMKWLAAIWIANFFAFVAIACYLGGDAINGYVKDGHYFLVWKGHATEVARSTYLYSKWHALGLFAVLAVIMLHTALFQRRRNAVR